MLNPAQMTQVIRALEKLGPYGARLGKLFAMIDMDEAEMLITHDAPPGYRPPVNAGGTIASVMIIITPRQGLMAQASGRNILEALMRVLDEAALPGGMLA